MMFVNTTQGCFLYQHIAEPTRYRQGEEPSVLDLVFSNEEGMVHNLAYQPGLGDSDHICIKFDLVTVKKVNKNTQPQPDYFKANYNAIRNKLTNIDWEQTLSGNFGNSYQLFLELLTTSMEGFVPNRTPHNKKHNIYMNSNAIKHKNKKQKLWTKYTLSRRDTDYVNFVKCKNQLRSVTRKLRKSLKYLWPVEARVVQKCFGRMLNPN